MHIPSESSHCSFSGHGSPSASLSQGFTLIELIIALTLVSLISVLLFAGLRLGTRASEGVEAISQQTAEPRIVYNFLAQTLSQAREKAVTFDGEQVLLFRGDAQNLEFVAPLSQHVGTPGLYILRLSLEQDAATRFVLTRWLLHPEILNGLGSIPTWQPFDSDTDQTNTWMADEDTAQGVFGSALLLDRVRDLEISYFGVPEGQDDPEWNSQWLLETHMPLAVRFHLATEQQVWPDIIIRLPR